jgi:LmbE family N-acetylglucosaminyl deacetylase
MADAGAPPLILTVFGGKPTGPLNRFAQEMHEQWGVGAGDAVDRRRAEERCAATELGAQADWLDLLDAIYRGKHYTSDDELFGPVHPDEAALPREIVDRVRARIETHSLSARLIYVPLGIGNHVDHQHVLAAGRLLARQGYNVFAYEDFPYAGDPAWRARIDDLGRAAAAAPPEVRPLTDQQLARRVNAVLCYASQHAVIFRHQGDPADATRGYASTVGGDRPAERFWPLGSLRSQD